MNAYGKLTPKPVSPGDRAVRLDNGEVWEFKNKGVKRVVARPPFWRDVWKMFPQSFIIDSVFLNSVQTDRGWLLNPDPIQTSEIFSGMVENVLANRSRPSEAAGDAVARLSEVY
jgi:hypothetical protein